MLADERANPVVADIAAAVGEAADASYDLELSTSTTAGPGARAQRRALRTPFLTEVRRLLRPGGVVAIWSTEASSELEATLEQVFGNAETTGYDVACRTGTRVSLHVARVGAVASAE